jgi:hypothetical protein
LRAGGEIQRKSRFSPQNGHASRVQSLVISAVYAANSLLSGSMEFQWNFGVDQRIEAAVSIE